MHVAVLYTVAIAVPLIALLVLFILRPRTRESPQTNTTTSLATPKIDAACAQPTPCVPGDTCACGHTCQAIPEGYFCLPPKPFALCATPPPGDNYMPGEWRWGGWANVNVQDWVCSCPEGYPPGPDGACTRSGNLCRYGKWTCPSPCDALHAQGTCDCTNVPCIGDGDCAGTCANGTCVDQRLGIDRISGFPTCVPDTCTNNVVKCIDNNTCPPGGTCVNGICSGSSCSTNDQCGPTGVCRAGVCSWGVWKPGGCACPENCTSNFSACVC